MNNDIINGMFELISGVLIILNILKLYKDKVVKGISVIPTILFTLWGIWNLYYYPSLNQYFSFAGGLLLATTNFIWLFMAFYYKKYGRIN